MYTESGIFFLSLAYTYPHTGPYKSLALHTILLPYRSIKHEDVIKMGKGWWTTRFYFLINVDLDRIKIGGK